VITPSYDLRYGTTVTDETTAPFIISSQSIVQV
jgi:hypothetical protein